MKRSSTNSPVDPQDDKLQGDLDLLSERLFITEKILQDVLLSVGAGLNGSNTRTNAPLTKPRLSGEPVQRYIHSGRFGTLTCQSLGLQHRHWKHQDGTERFSVAQAKDFKVVGFTYINVESDRQRMTFTLSSFPMNASIECISAEGWLLLFKGNIWKGRN